MTEKRVCVLVKPSSKNRIPIDDHDISLFDNFILIDTDMVFVDNIALFLEGQGKHVAILNSLDQLPKMLVYWDVIADYHLEMRFY